MKVKKSRQLILLFGASLIAAIAASMMLVNIFEHKQESKSAFYRVVELDDSIQDPETWGKNFPLQYDGYKRTVDQQRTRFGESEAVQKTPSKVDPRSVVAQSRLEQDPRLRTIWNGYAFAVDFREDRGHAYMLEDQTFTERQSASKQPGACLNCHASIYVPLRRIGHGDLFKGFTELNAMPYAEARKHVTHPIACIDCHDPGTMQLRITRPAFMEGIKVLKLHQGIKNYDVNKMATRQEMRTFVCAQCHVEYYFKGPGKELTFPWAKGNKVEEIVAYYDEVKQKDWSHKTTDSPLLKAQHPEFEMWSQGIHARSGVACADCHMPYYREGAMKISDHHVQSPLLNINRSCQTCHHWPEAELKARVETIQERTFRLRNLAMDAVVALIHDIERAKDKRVGETALKEAQDFHRRAQFYLDFVEAENSTGFHAPAEAARILGESIDFSRRGQEKIRK